MLILSLLLASQVSSINVTATPFPNDLTGPIGCTIFESGVLLEGDKDFGGISALRLSGDKSIFLSDNGLIYEASAVRNDAGFITGFIDIERSRIKDEKGRPLDKLRGDSESLATSGDEKFVGFERQHRISPLRKTAKGWQELSSLVVDSRQQLSGNSGYEALDILPNGKLIAISEGLDEDGYALVLFLDLSSETITRGEGRYRPAPQFNVTDASVDSHSGDIFILERAFSRIRGPRARIVRIAADDLEPGTLIEGQELAKLSALNGIDNMEGLDVERREDGTLIFHMISDDNFNRLQKTVLMGFTVSEIPACLPRPKD